jgi:hypothetical protein
MQKMFRQLAIAAVVAVVIGSGAALADPSNKWRIVVNHSSDSAGEVVFRITPVGGEPLDVTTTFEKSTRENDIAKHMVKAFKAQLDKDTYHIERDDWEAVLVKKRHGAEDFDLALVSSSLPGVAFDLKRE